MSVCLGHFFFVLFPFTANGQGNEYEKRKELSELDLEPQHGNRAIKLNAKEMVHEDPHSIYNSGVSTEGRSGDYCTIYFLIIPEGCK